MERLKVRKKQVTLVSKTASVGLKELVVVTDYSAQVMEMKLAMESVIVTGQVQQALETTPVEMRCFSVNQVAVKSAAVRARHGPQLQEFPPTMKPSISV
jgi:hypothetical protein